MKKLSRSLLTLLLAFVMVFGMAIGVSAQTTSTPTTVNVHFCTRDATASSNSLTNIVTVNLSTTQETSLKDAVDAALVQAKSDAFSSNTYSATWVATGSNYYVDAITIDGVERASKYKITYDETTKLHTYTGSSWVWNYDGGSSYPNYYLNQVTVGTNSDLYLIYETSSFTY